MSTILSERTPVARKDHHCGAYEVIMNSYSDSLFTYAELRQIAKVRRQSGKILKGQRYMGQVGIWEGDFNVFRAHPELDEICRKYDLYEY